MTDTDTTGPRRIIIDAFGPVRLIFDRRDGYVLEIDGQRIRPKHLREALAALDAATGGTNDTEGK